MRVEISTCADIDQLNVNWIDTLGVDVVPDATSGHPGTPIGLALAAVYPLAAATVLIPWNPKASAQNAPADIRGELLHDHPVDLFAAQEKVRECCR